MQSIFAKMGYFTFCVQTNPWLGEPQFGFNQFKDYRFLANYDSKGAPISANGRKAPPYVDGGGVAASADRLMGRAATSFRPFFGYVHLMDVHEPYRPPAPYNALFSAPDSAGISDDEIRAQLRAMREPGAPVPSEKIRQRIIDLYDGGVRYADKAVGRLLAGLEAHGLSSNTIVIICSDHGEEFWEHGSRSHGATLYSEVLRVPLVMAGPGLPTSAVISDRVRQIDVLPTVLELVGAKNVPRMDGLSVLPLLKGATADPERSSASHTSTTCMR